MDKLTAIHNLLSVIDFHGLGSHAHRSRPASFRIDLIGVCADVGI
jgi:hypothetical protein